MKTSGLFYRGVSVIAGLALLLDGLALADFLLHPASGDYTFQSPLYRAVNVLALVPLTLLVGFLIIRRVPGNSVGPLLIVWSGTVAFNSIRLEIGPLLFGLYYSYNLIFGWFAFFLLFLHFPDGKIHPPFGARLIYWLLPWNLVMSTLTFLSTQPLEVPSHLENIFFLPAMKPFAEWILLAGVMMAVPMLALIPVSLAVRYREAGFLERQQMKWLALFAGIHAIYSTVVGIAFPLLTGGVLMGFGDQLPGMVFFFLSGLFPPLVIGISVLRYRLWDIDRIIRRTLIYSILSLILALIYLGSVLTLQTAFSILFRLAPDNLVIALSTLAIYILFHPLRRRVQRAIDRRFYRQKYNADQIQADFSEVVRREVRLEPLAGALLRYVEETMHPEEVSLWLVASSKNRPSPGVSTTKH